MTGQNLVRKGADAQISLFGPACKVPTCPAPAVGSSITGTGHVCAEHNRLEWGKALVKSEHEWVREHGRRCVA